MSSPSVSSSCCYRRQTDQDSIRLPSQFVADLWLSKDANYRSLLEGDPLQYIRVTHCMHDHGAVRLSDLRQPHERQCAQQLSISGPRHRANRQAVLWPEHADDTTSGVLRMQRGDEQLLVPRRAISAEPPPHLQQCARRQCYAHQLGDMRSRCSL